MFGKGIIENPSILISDDTISSADMETEHNITKRFADITLIRRLYYRTSYTTGKSEFDFGDGKWQNNRTWHT